jgi:hypothetical protein
MASICVREELFSLNDRAPFAALWFADLQDQTILEARLEN